MMVMMMMVMTAMVMVMMTVMTMTCPGTASTRPGTVLCQAWSR